MSTGIYCLLHLIFAEKKHLGRQCGVVDRVQESSDLKSLLSQGNLQESVSSKWFTEHDVCLESPVNGHHNSTGTTGWHIATGSNSIIPKVYDKHRVPITIKSH